MHLSEAIALTWPRLDRLYIYTLYNILYIMYIYNLYNIYTYIFVYIFTVSIG